MSDDVKGTLIKGADGEVYFIREEILEACKVTEADMKEFCDGLIGDGGGDVEGFAMASGPMNRAILAQGPWSRSAGIPDLGQAASTIMCPGTMHSGSFQINPGMTRGY